MFGNRMCAYSTPLRTVLQGLLAGAIGTVAMDLLLYRRNRRNGGPGAFIEWETAAGVNTWEDAPAPAQVGKRLVEGFLQRPLDPGKVRLLTNLVHWAYGSAWGMAFSILAGSGPKRRSSYGLPFGLFVWSTGYAVLPSAGIYRQIWEYDFDVLWKDASAHLVYGMATATAFKLLQ